MYKNWKGKRMFNFLKKDISPVPIVSNSQPQIMEKGKEVQFKDPKTGQQVYHRSLSSEHRKLLGDAFTNQALIINEYLQTSRQFLAWQQKFLMGEKAIQDNEKILNTTMDEIRNELKLDKRWGINPQLMVLEKRESPIN